VTSGIEISAAAPCYDSGASTAAAVSRAPSTAKRLLRRLPVATQQRLRRFVRRPRWGNLRRLEPLSRSFGFDRGTPIDRYYLRCFLSEHADAIRGAAGEVSERRYVDEFGGDRVTGVEVIDIDPDNPRATIVADLARVGSLPRSRFDCLLVVQTLQYTCPLEVAIATCVQALRPGGTLLLVLPALTAHDPRVPVAGDYWRFLPPGVEALLHTAAPDARCTVTGYGNLVTTFALLQGVSAEELTRQELDHHDPRFPVTVCARVDVADT
jgi:SAM-dependent methyltransferase